MRHFNFERRGKDMKKFFEEYGETLLIVFVIVALILIAKPVSGQIKEYVQSMTNNLAVKTTNGIGGSETGIAYTIEYKSTTGKKLGSTTIRHEEGTTTTVTPPDKSGYTTPAGQSVTWGKEKKTITFTYKPITYSITYYLNGGVNDETNPTEYTIETASQVFKSASKSGYVFGGFYLDSTLKNKTTRIAQGSTGDITLYTKWNATAYTLTLDTNGGDSDNVTKNLAAGTSYGSLTTPSRNGYNFDGWFTSKTGGNKVSSSTIMGSTNTTIYAHWSAKQYTYNVKYVSSSGKSLGSQTITGNYNSTTTVQPLKFAGYTSPASQSVTFNTTSAQTITFTYEPIEYTITYIMNGGTNSASNPTTYTVESSAITLSAATKDSDNIFRNWYTDSSYKTKVTTITTGSTGNKQFYAYYDEPILGISRSLSSSSVNWTRTDDAKDLKFTTSVQGTSTGSSDFDSYYPYSEMKRVTISGNVMVRIPKFYYKRVQENGTEIIQISKVAKDGFSLHPAFDRPDGIRDYIYVGAYDGSLSGSKLVSETGKEPLTNITRPQARTYAQANGSNWQLMDYDTYNAIWMLIWVETANSDVQTAIGRGIVDNSYNNGVAPVSITTGQADNVPNLTGRSTGKNGTTSQVVWRGIEALWGTVWQLIDGVNKSNYDVYLTNDQSAFGDTITSSYTKIGQTLATSEGYVKTMSYDASNPYAMFATAVGGTYETYWADYHYITQGGVLLFAGGCWSDGSKAGFYLDWPFTAAHRATNVGARLEYLG